MSTDAHPARPDYRFDAALVRACCPAELLLRDQWVCWAYELREGKWSKVPKRANRERNASSTDPRSWTTFDKACEAASVFGYAGVGYVFAADDPYVGIDVDDCFDAATGALAPWALSLIDELNTYAERSPSGVGFKAIARVTEPITGGGERHYLTGVPKANVAVYAKDRYFTITGDRLDDWSYAIEERTDVLKRWDADLFASAIGESSPNDAAAHPSADRRAEGQSCQVDRALNAALAGMLGVALEDGADGSRRLFAYCCRAVEHDLNDVAALRAIAAAAKVRPFARPWSDAEIIKRLRQAERKVRRGSAIGERMRSELLSGTSADRPATQRPRPTPWMPFPVDLLPGVLRRYLEAISDSRGIEPAMIAVPMLAALSGAIGNARRLRLKRDYFVPAVLWPVIVAESGGGKSPALDAAMAPIRELQLAAHDQYQSALAEHVRAMADWKANGKEGDAPEPPQPMRHFYVGDATVEAIAVRLADNDRGLLLWLDELAAWFKSWNAYKRGGGDRESFLSFYDARAAKIDRKATDGGPRTLIVRHAFVSVTGGIQPSILRGVLADPELAQCGILARLLLVMPPERQMLWRDREPAQEAIDAYSRLIAALALLDFDAAAGPVIVRMSDAARVAFREWFDRMERARTAAPDAAERAAIPKLREAAARISLILHVSACVAGDEPGISADVLDERSMLAGIAIAEWFANESRRVRAMLAGGETEDQLRRRLRAIAESDTGIVPGTVTVREWDKRRRIGTDAARAELLELVDAGLGTLAYESTGGRQAERFRPSPVQEGPDEDETLELDEDA